jgi:hypothetical protein
MMIEWFNAREAALVGAALADEFAPRTVPAAARSSTTTHEDQSKALQKLLRRADREVRTLRLNFYKKARFANAFKWRLTENGVDREMADEVTQLLVLHLSQNQTGPAQDRNSATAPADRPSSTNAASLLAQGNKSFARGDYAAAAAFYQKLLEPF